MSVVDQTVQDDIGDSEISSAHHQRSASSLKISISAAPPSQRPASAQNQPSSSSAQRQLAQNQHQRSPTQPTASISTKSAQLIISAAPAPA